MTERTAKQVAELHELVRGAEIASALRKRRPGEIAAVLAALIGPQLAHDLAVLLGAECRCGERHDQRHDDQMKE
jgi:hypothetical protein